MALIIPNTTYPNGAGLPVGGHNANIYSTSTGRGILSEPNGGLQIANLDPSFQVRDEHVMPEEAVVARMDGSTTPMDVYSNAFGIREEEENTTTAYVPIAGLGQRVYVPYDVSALLWQWSFHVSGFKPFTSRLASLETDIGTSVVRVYFDGVEVAVFRRSLPISAWIVLAESSAGPETKDSLIDYGNTTQLWYDTARLMKNVSKGYHEVSAKLFLPRLVFDPNDVGDVGEMMINVNPYSVFDLPAEVEIDETIKYSVDVYTRASFGNRSVRCVMFK